MVKTLVLIHGWASAPEIWQVQKEYFSKSYEVVLPDISRAEDIKEASGIVYNAVQDKKDFVLLGWSLGWLVILELLQNQGLKPQGLICVNSTAKFIDSGNSGAGPTAVHLAKMLRDCKRNPQKTVEDFYESILYGTGKSMFSDIRFKNFDYDKLIYGLYMLRDCDYRDFIQRIATPTLIIAGAKDKITPLQASEYMQKRIKNSLLKVLDCGHMPFCVKCDEFNLTLENFVKGL